MTEAEEDPDKAYDPFEFIGLILRHWMEEPVGIGLVLFLAFVLNVPAQTPDMIDPFFVGADTAGPAAAYIMLSFGVGWTVWFWMVGAIRAESLIPGGRYAHLRTTRQIKPKHPLLPAPYNFASHMAAWLAIAACLGRPVWLGLESLNIETGGGVLFLSMTALALVIGWLFAVGSHLSTGMMRVAMNREEIWGPAPKIFQMIIPPKLRQRIVHWGWSNRFSALLLGAAHVGWHPWLILAIIQFSFPVVFLIWLATFDLRLFGDPMPTPLAALLAICGTIGPLIFFLSVIRDITERVMRMAFYFIVPCFGTILNAVNSATGVDLRTRMSQAEILHMLDTSQRHSPGRAHGLRRFARMTAAVIMVSLVMFDPTDILVKDEVYQIRPTETSESQLYPVLRPDLASALIQWHTSRNLPTEGDVPLVIVAAEGGASRAAVWSLSVLGSLDRHMRSQDLAFSDHVFALSAVSGGALGALTFAQAYAEDGKDWMSHGALKTMGSKDFLTPSVAHLFSVDILRRFDVTGLFYKPYFSDRNVKLEEVFEGHWRQDWKFERTVDGNQGVLDWHQAQRGRAPHLVLNGVDPRTGARVATSTISLSPSGRYGVQGTEPILTGAFDFFRDFGNDISLSAAVMNAARFPVISPAGRYELATRPGHQRQIIDGGYYENYGVETAVELIDRIDALTASDFWTESWRPVPIMVVISNDAIGVHEQLKTVEFRRLTDKEKAAARAQQERAVKGLPQKEIAVNDIAGDEPVNLNLVKTTIGGISAWRYSLTGESHPDFQSVTITCRPIRRTTDTLKLAESYTAEPLLPIMGIFGTLAAHSQEALKDARASLCHEAGPRFFHFGLPKPVFTKRDRAPMNWVLNRRAQIYLTDRALVAVDSDVEQLEGLCQALGGAECRFTPPVLASN